MTALLSHLACIAIGVLLAYLLSRRCDFGATARQQRDAAVGALRDLIRSQPPARTAHRSAVEGRAWARACAVLAAHTDQSAGPAARKPAVRNGHV